MCIMSCVGGVFVTAFSLSGNTDLHKIQRADCVDVVCCADNCVMLRIHNGVLVVPVCCSHLMSPFHQTALVRVTRASHRDQFVCLHAQKSLFPIIALCIYGLRHTPSAAPVHSPLSLLRFVRWKMSINCCISY